MKIETLVKLTNTKDRTDLYLLFCEFVRGDYAEQVKGNSSDKAHLEAQVSKAFDSIHSLNRRLKRAGNTKEHLMKD
ncbi:MAG TPA: hypothetical protein EYN54_10640 [Methylococcaceae bacterium]|nr:hypothetical protein [Methylococcaceae bacterium]